MLKTISAALLAASVIAAPAIAAEAGKTTTTTAPAIKADQTQSKVSTTAPKTNAKTADIKSGAKVDTKSKAMNANAAITPDEHKTVRTHRHHHKHLSVKKSLKTQSSVNKPVTTEKRS